MIKLVEFAVNKDALGFKNALHGAIAEKVTAVLDVLREKVASDLFNESFKAVEAAARKSGASNPAAVAAAVGFKKYGKRRMEKAAHEGKPAKDVH
jgi:hypothetical protein